MRNIILITTLILNFVLTCMFTFAQYEEILWTEDFETDWISNWSVENGVWEVGLPNSGPDTSYRGVKCAATVLNGNYPNNANCRLIRFSPFIVPDSSENPRIRFWHWFSMENGCDWGKVQVSNNGGASWFDVSTSYSSTCSGIWTCACIDLSSFENQSLLISFYLHSDVSYDAPGWYIDDISFITGSYTFNNPENWESGIGDWYAERGTWEVGEPVFVTNAHSGQNCLATKLSGNYENNVDSRFVSPRFIVPDSAENPRIRFWHWFSFENGCDWGKVQVSIDGGTSWIDVSGQITNVSSIWSHVVIDLFAYEKQALQIAFFMHSDVSYDAPGWYIDDIEIIDNSNLSIDAGTDLSINFGSSAILNASVSGGSAPYYFAWSPAEGLDDPFTLNPVANPSDTTIYTLTVRDDHGCFRTDNVTVNVIGMSGVNDNNLENIYIYPNPAKNKLYVSVQNGAIINEVNIYNHVGRIILNRHGIINTIDVSMLRHGIYFVELVTKNSIIIEKLIIR